MKITNPMFSNHATGALGWIGYFSGAIGKTRLSSYARYPRDKSAYPQQQLNRMRAALSRWQTHQPTHATPWPIMSRLLLAASTTRSISLSNPRATSIPTPATSPLANLIHNSQ